jgi:hypothetical protein
MTDLIDLTNTLNWLRKYKPEPAKEAANFITQNAIQTPDSTYLVSSHVHDYKEHKDANGGLYIVDGGYDYIRRSGQVDYENLTLMSDDPFELAREKLIWGSYGKSGKEGLHYIRLKDMEEGHIANVIQYLKDHQVGGRATKWRIDMMQEELKYRKLKLLED